MANQIFKAVVLASGLSFSVASSAATLIDEGFDNVSTLDAAGWSLVNQSTPGGSVPTYFQGSTAVFNSQAGAANSYIASSYNVTPVGGTLSNWLVTPTFSTEVAGSVSFWLRGDAFEGTRDVVTVGFVGTVPTSTVTGTFASGAQTIVANTTGWQKVTYSFGARGAGSVGRFAWEHTNRLDANYIGIDSVLVSNVSAVPEPSETLLLGVGLFSVFLMRRRAR
jgi:hypothetical protein